MIYLLKIVKIKFLMAQTSESQSLIDDEPRSIFKGKIKLNP